MIKKGEKKGFHPSICLTCGQALFLLSGFSLEIYIKASYLKLNYVNNSNETRLFKLYRRVRRYSRQESPRSLTFFQRRALKGKAETIWKTKSCL